jgi:hypothetical protein
MSAIHDALKKASKQKRSKGARDPGSEAPVEIAIPPSFERSAEPAPPAPDGDLSAGVSAPAQRNPWPLWIASGLAAAGLFASVLFFVAKEGERSLRRDVQQQLASALEEIAIAQTRFADLAREKSELEEQFYANVEEFERSVSEYEAKIGRLAERSRRLAVLSKSLRRESRTLRETSLSKDRTIDQLMGQLGAETAEAAPAAAEQGGIS